MKTKDLDAKGETKARMEDHVGESERRNTNLVLVPDSSRRTNGFAIGGGGGGGGGHGSSGGGSGRHLDAFYLVNDESLEEKKEVTN